MKNNTAELVGKTLNEFKILEWKREKGHSYFLVICPICNNKKWVRTEPIVNGEQKSCGCLSKNSLFKPKNIEKQKFGRLTAIRPTELRNKNNGSVIWECVCQCGKIKNVAEYLLTTNQVQSCGCILKESRGKNGKKAGEVTSEHCIDGTNVISLIPGKKLLKTNTSGITGVSWDKTRNKWTAQIVFKGKTYSLGRYERKKDAKKIRELAEKEMYSDFLKWYKKEFPGKIEKIECKRNLKK